MKTALIIGGAACVFDDIRAALELFTPDITVAVNAVGVQVQNIDFWVSQHPHQLLAWARDREAKGWPVPQLWTSSHKWDADIGNKVSQLWYKEIGASGLLGVRVAQREECDRVVLAGIPMTKVGAHFDSPKVWKECEAYRQGWRNDPKLKNFVRSMSGWTRELLGAPDTDWFRK